MNFSSCLLAFVIHKKKCNYGLLCEYLPSQCCTVMFQHLRASRMVGAKSAPHSSNTRNQYCRDRQGNVTKLSTTLHTSFSYTEVGISVVDVPTYTLYFDSDPEICPNSDPDPGPTLDPDLSLFRFHTVT